MSIRQVKSDFSGQKRNTVLSDFFFQKILKKNSAKTASFFLRTVYLLWSEEFFLIKVCTLFRRVRFAVRFYARAFCCTFCLKKQRFVESRISNKQNRIFVVRPKTPNYSIGTPSFMARESFARKVGF